MTYKQRVREDLEALWGQDGAKDIFGFEYKDGLKEIIKQLEGWLIRLIVTQTAIISFLLAGFVSQEASISLFGISLKATPGLREFLIVFSSTLAVLILFVSSSRDIRVFVLEKLMELTTESRYLDLAMLATAAPFHLRAYIPKRYQLYIFSTRLTKLSFGLLATLLILMFVSLFLFSIAVQAIIICDIYYHPTLPPFWSTAVLGYAFVGFAAGFLWLLRMHCPLPYRDQGLLLELQRLEKADPAAYRRRISEIFATRG
jgi:hypothetical protein